MVRRRAKQNSNKGAISQVLALPEVCRVFCPMFSLPPLASNIHCPRCARAIAGSSHTYHCFVPMTFYALRFLQRSGRVVSAFHVALVGYIGREIVFFFLSA